MELGYIYYFIERIRLYLCDLQVGSFRDLFSWVTKKMQRTSLLFPTFKEHNYFHGVKDIRVSFLLVWIASLISTKKVSWTSFMLELWIFSNERNTVNHRRALEEWKQCSAFSPAPWLVIERDFQLKSYIVIHVIFSNYAFPLKYCHYQWEANFFTLKCLIAHFLRRYT